MSTKALLRLIQHVRKTGTEEEAGLAVDALVELAAIERAAWAVSNPLRVSPADLLAGQRLMESIAPKEAP